MGRLGNPLPWLLTALALGIAIADKVEPSAGLAWFLVSIAFLFLIGGKIARRRLHPYVFLAIACLSFCALGILSLSLRLPKNQATHFLQFTTSGKHIMELRLEERLRPGAFGSRWIGTVLAVNGRGTTGKSLIRFPVSEADSSWRAGDHLTVYADCSPFKPPSNPHGFDYAAYMKHMQVAGQIRLSPGLNHKGTSKPATILIRIARLRAYLSKQLSLTDLNPEPGSILRALLLGDRSELNPELYQAYQRSGTVHLLAISGLHVGIVMGLISWLLLPLRYHPKGRLWHLGISLGFLWIYALLVGFGPSVVRASVLFTILAWVFYRNRKGDGLHFLALAALIMLGILNPYWLFQTGFQLSFAAVWGILSFYSVLRRKWPYKDRIRKRMGDLIALSLSAQLGVLPISLYHFHQLPLLFLPASLILVPLVGILLSLGFLVLLLSAAELPTAWLTASLNALLGGQNALVRLLSRQEGFVLSAIRWEAVHLLLSVVILFCLSRWIRQHKVRWLQLGGIAMAALQVWTLYLSHTTNTSGEWMVPHSIGESSVLVRESNQVVLHTDEPEAWKRMLQDYTTGEGVGSVKYRPLGNAYRLKGLRILLVDSSGVYPTGGIGPDYLILRDSPPIHMERLLKTLRPAMVIADGSNYTGDITRWAASCKTLGLPFHATAQSGAFRQPID